MEQSQCGTALILKEGNVVKCWILLCYDMLCCADQSEQTILDSLRFSIVLYVLRSFRGTTPKDECWFFEVLISVNYPKRTRHHTLERTWNSISSTFFLFLHDVRQQFSQPSHSSATRGHRNILTVILPQALASLNSSAYV